MKDLFENKLTSLIFGLLNGWDITLAEYAIPNVINEVINNRFWMYLFNFVFCSSKDLLKLISVI